jgi:hypothetical protein
LAPALRLLGAARPGCPAGRGRGMASRSWSCGATKERMAAVGACMRKLLIGCGMFRNRAPFDPAWASKKAP